MFKSVAKQSSDMLTANVVCYLGSAKARTGIGECANETRIAGFTSNESRHSMA